VALVALERFAQSFMLTKPYNFILASS